jgi:glycosyltransferase involved in cell wall biosynthesis
MLELSVIVPVRDAESMVFECLQTICACSPREIIVVDGLSSDCTVDIADRFPVDVVSDEGRGVAAARMIGVKRARSPVVALIDVDIVLPPGSLECLLEEFLQGEYAALQAGLHSVAGPRYWGQALVTHHNWGCSKNWPGLMATIFKRQVLLDYKLDERFLSGEDIEFRWRLRRAGLKIGVSRRTLVTHRFDDTYACARAQWKADGEGLGRMLSKYGWRAMALGGMPLAGSIRGVLLSLVRLQPRWIPYYLAYLVYNYLAMPRGWRQTFS